MDWMMMQKITAARVKKKFGSHKVLYSKYTPQIPASAEREYVRICDAYMLILKTELKNELPKLKRAYESSLVDEQQRYRSDGFTDLMLAVDRLFAGMKNRINANTLGFGLRKKLESLANLNRKLTVKEWKKAIKATLGIDIREDYYLGDFYEDQLETWVNQNVNLIKTIPAYALDKMRDIVYDGFADGKTTDRITKEILAAYDTGKRHAEFIARDQTAKLNGQIQRAQQTDAGVNQYIWSTVKDERTRKSHRELDGKKFSWDDAPVNSDGRKCHPGEDYGCRCIGRPVFNLETLNLPVEEGVQFL